MDRRSILIDIKTLNWPGALVTLAEALHRVDNTAGAEAEEGAEAGAESGAEVGVGETISAAERLQYFQQVGH